MSQPEDENPFAPFPYNATLWEYPDLCTRSTCPLSLAAISYIPNLAGNAFFAALFGIVLCIQLFLGIRYRTWGFMVGMVGGCLCGLIGYVGRIELHKNQYSGDGFFMYIIPLTIGPAFLAASIYLCIARIVMVFGRAHSRLSPRTYTIFFIICDFICLLLQAAGGAIASSNDSDEDSQAGIDTMLAGLILQVVALILFFAVCAHFAFRIRRANAAELNPDFANVRQAWHFKGFLVALGLSALVIFVRSVFRVAELSEGFDGPLANDEETFMVLEGAMISIAVLLMTVWHPGLAFQNRWSDAGWKLRKGRKIETPGSEKHEGP